MHRNTDRPGLIGNRTGNRLTDPPGRIGTELVAALVLKLVDGLHQADIAFLNQVEELKTSVRILLGNTDNETQVRLNQLGFPALDLIFCHIEMLDCIFDLLCRYESFFGLERSNPALRRLIHFFYLVERLLRTARLAFDGEKVLSFTAESLECLSTGFAADPQPPLATDNLTFRRSDLNGQLPHALHHPILQYTM